MDVTERTPVRERTVTAVLAKQLAERPDKVALLDDRGTTLTYAELDDRARRLAAALRALGAARGDFVLLMLDNHAGNAVSWVGVNLGAMAAVPINTAFKGQLLSYVVADAGVRIAIIDGAYCDRFATVLDDLPELKTVVVHGEPNADLSSRVRVVAFDTLFEHEPLCEDPPLVSDISTVMYTSGTEGSSKGVLGPHGHMYQMCAAFLYETTPDDTVLITAPMFHSTGLITGLYCALRSGATAVIETGFSVTRFWDVVREHHCTQTVLIGAMVDFLWRQPASPEDTNNPLEHAMIIPAVPYLAEFGTRFRTTAWSAYGQTETGIITLTDPGEARPFLCGRPRSFIEIRLVDDDDDDVAPGEVGEIIVRSREPWSLMTGYHRRPETTVATWRNLWLHTGDSAYKTTDGRYIFVDRKRDALRRRGENVSSAEVERCIASRPDIEEVAIVAAPSEHHEDDILAVVVPAAGSVFDPEAILRDLVERLPYFMVPRYYDVIDSMPMTATMKIRKSDLRARGITATTWDCEQHGFKVTRTGLQEPSALID